jgi:hypothetical protein
LEALIIPAAVGALALIGFFIFLAIDRRQHRRRGESK